MSKAKLVLDEMPSTCAKCKLCQFDRVGYYCAVNEEDVTDYRSLYIRPEWCELEEVNNNSEKIR